MRLISLRTMSLNYSQPSDDSLLDLALALDLVGRKTLELHDVFAQLPPTPLNLRRFASEVSLGTSAIRRELDEAMVAIRLLIDHHPLASAFPDGAPPPPILSPRQVIYLAGLASKSSR